MSVVSWGAPTLQFYPLANGTPPTTSWHPSTGLLSGVIEISGDILLENSSALETTAGDEKTLRNEKGVDVDRKRLPSSYVFNTSIIKKKAYTSPFTAHNGIVEGDYAMRLIPEDPTTIGFQMAKCNLGLDKGWDSQQGALDVLRVNGVQPDDTSKDICEDYTEPTPTPTPGQEDQ